MNAQAPQEAVLQGQKIQHGLVVPIRQETNGASRDCVHDEVVRGRHDDRQDHGRVGKPDNLTRQFGQRWYPDAGGDGLEAEFREKRDGDRDAVTTAWVSNGELHDGEAYE